MDLTPLEILKITMLSNVAIMVELAVIFLAVLGCKRRGDNNNYGPK